MLIYVVRAFSSLTFNSILSLQQMFAFVYASNWNAFYFFLNIYMSRNALLLFFEF